jgi:hypothetical protein
MISLSTGDMLQLVNLCSQLKSDHLSQILLPVQGLYQRPLTANNIEKHLGALGLEAEFATHSMIRGLSGGQKVKLVLAAATWQVRVSCAPHVILSASSRQASVAFGALHITAVLSVVALDRNLC